MSKSKQQSNDFEPLIHAISKLSNVLNLSLDEGNVIQDATIHRFKYCIELFWKLLKRCLEQQGHKIEGPRSAIKKAYQIGWLHYGDESIWLDMLDARNLTSHTYNEDTATYVYEQIKSFYPKIHEVVEELRVKQGQ